MATRRLQPHPVPRGQRPWARRARLRLAAAATLLLVGSLSAEASLASGRPVPVPRLLLETEAGAIVIRLAPAAAPESVARLVRLTRGPIFRDEVIADSESARGVGYFDGLAFDYTHPRVELRTAMRSPAELFEVAVEIDAVALGLDADRLADAAAAMRVLQEELFPAASRRGLASPLLARWLEQWQATMRPDFLVGASRQEVNEALGWRYRPGLASRPVLRGAVFLPSRTPEAASLALGIALADLPRRTGKETVVGEVESGLEVAERIALAPLLDPGSRLYRPRQPVRILAASIVDGPSP